MNFSLMTTNKEEGIRKKKQKGRSEGYDVRKARPGNTGLEGAGWSEGRNEGNFQKLEKAGRNSPREPLGRNASPPLP